MSALRSDGMLNILDSYALVFGLADIQEGTFSAKYDIDKF